MKVKMEFIEDKEFNVYIEKYKKLSLEDKKKLVEKEFEELIVVLKKINEDMGNNPKLLFNREILDLKKDNASEDDFVEATFVYINSIKELLATVIKK